MQARLFRHNIGFSFALTIPIAQQGLKIVKTGENTTAIKGRY